MKDIHDIKPLLAVGIDWRWLPWLLAILIAVAYWDSHRLAALGGLTGFFMIAGAGLAWLALHKARTKPRLFDASLAELSKDRQHLTPGS